MLAPATMDTTSTNHEPTQEATARRRKPQPASTTTCEHPGARRNLHNKRGRPLPLFIFFQGRGGWNTSTPTHWHASPQVETSPHMGCGTAQ